MPISDSSPFRHLSEEESHQLFEDCHAGKTDIFCGEEPSVPNCPDRHQLVGTRYLSATPEELLEVAKNLGDTKAPAKELIEKAYQLICEAHLVSRNIEHWNTKVNRHHLSEKIHNLVYGLKDIDNTTDKVPRKSLLVAYENMRGHTVSEKTATERFNQWLKDEIRLDNFLSTIGYSNHSSNHDPDLLKTLYDNGWIEQVHMSRGVHIIVPKKTKPAGKPKRKVQINSHITAPYWTTTDAWWPEADPEILKQRREKLLCDKEANFKSAFQIANELEQYDLYRDVLERKRSSKKRLSNTRRDSESRQFLPKSGPRDNDTGKFKKKKKIP